MGSEEYPDLGSWVKARREALDITQEGLAMVVSCSIATIRKIEQNRPDYRPSEEMLRSLMDALEIPEDQRSRFREMGRKRSPYSKAITARPAQTTRATSRPFPTSPGHLPWSQVLLLLTGAVVLGVSLLVISFSPVRDHPEFDQGITSLVGPSDRRVVVETANQRITSGQVIRVGERVTVTFQLQNIDVHPIRIKSIVIGARGPGAKTFGWSAPVVPFISDDDLVLQPGQSHTYRQSREFEVPGDYFVEPNIQDPTGRWGGISPFTRIEFDVIE